MEATPEMIAAEFTFPMLPPTLNTWSRQHWSVRDRLTKTWKLAAAIYVDQRVPFPGPCEVTITYCPSKRAKGKNVDLDNYAAKFVLDAIKGRVIVDDSPEYVPRLVIQHGEETETGETRVEVKEIASKTPR